jgi:hypothetical protein
MLVSLSSAVNATVLQETGPGTISDNDPDPVIFVTDSTVTEGTSLEFLITLNVASEVDVVFDAQTYEGSAIDPEDFTAQTLSDITIPAGSISYSVWIATIDDLINESSEAMTLSLANVQDAQAGDFVGAGTINDNEPLPGLYVTDASAVTEGQSAVYVVTLSAVSGLDVSFNFATYDDTAVSTQDYGAYSGSATIYAGQGGVTIQVSTVDDARDEVPSEYFTLSIASPVNSSIVDAVGDGEILDNDSAPYIFISDASELEGDTLYFTVTISSLSDLNVDFIAQSFDGSAGSADYSSISLASQIPAGSLGITVSVNSTEDLIYEADETFTVSLLSIVNASVQTPGDETGTGTIQNDEVLPQIFISDSTVNEGETASLYVTISGLNQADVIFTYETVDDSALAASDYTAHALTTVTIPGGSLSHTIQVVTTENAVYEPTEQFFVNVSATSGATGTPQGTVTINDDDGMPEIFVSDASAVTEGETSQFVITLSAMTSFDVSFTYLNYDDTATSTQDFTAISGTATIPANTLAITLGVWTTDDDRDEEPTETYTLSIASPNNATISDALGTGTINDNDNPPELFIDDIVITEGDSGSFTVTISALSDREVTVQYRTYDGTNGAISLNAYQPSDYTAIALTTLTIPAGQISRSVWVETAEDGLDEADYEDFNVSLSSPINASINDGLGLGQIADDEGAPLIYISDLSVNEGETANMSVTLSGVSAFDVIFTYQTYDVSATTADADYTGITAQWTISSGNLTTTVPVTSLEDSLDEDDETLLVSLASIQNANAGDAEATLTILDDDALPNIYIADSTVNEGETLNFTVSLNVISGRDVTVQRRSYDGSATSPDDFAAVSLQTITISKGSLSTQVTSVTEIDGLYESAEDMMVSLSSAVNATIVQSTSTGTINDIDTAPDLYVTDAATVTEGQSSIFVVTLSEASALNVTFDYQTYDDTATSTQDYSAFAGSATIYAGQSGVTIQVSTTDDARDEGASEYFTLSIASAVNSNIVDADGDGGINDNDNPPAIYIADASDLEGTTLTFMVTLSSASDLTIDFVYNTYDGTGSDKAESASDYTAQSNITVQIPAGSITHNILVVTTEDAGYEFDEIFSVSLSGFVNVTAGDIQGTGTIQNDDYIPFVWMGWAGDGQWTNVGNWSTSVVPGASDTAIFNDMCVNCGVNINATISVGGVTIASDFAGAITQSAGAAITIGTNDWMQQGGSFVGGASLFVVNSGDLSVTGGDFTATSGTLSIFNGSMGLVSPAAFSHNSGSVHVERQGLTADFGLVNSAGPFQNLNLKANFVEFELNGGAITVLGALDLHGTSTSDGKLNNGSIYVGGDLNVVSAGMLGTATIHMVGSASGQSISGTSCGSCQLPNVIVNAGSNDITVSGYLDVYGTWRVESVGDMNMTGTELQFEDLTGYSTRSMIPGPVTYDGVRFSGFGTTYNLNGGNMTIAGPAYFEDGTSASASIQNGEIHLLGDLTGTSHGAKGDAVLRWLGSANVTLSAPTHLPTGAFIVDKSGYLDLASNITLAGAGQDLLVNSGTVRMQGYDLTITDTISIASGAVVDTGCGQLSAAITINNGGTIIDGVASPNMTIADASGNEGTTLQFTVSLDGAKCDGNVTVDYASASGTAISGTDFTATSGTLTFTPGETIKTINVVTTQETTSEGNETFTVSLSSITNGTLVDSVAVGTIINDDLAAFTWTGLGADSNWTTAANWSTTVVPGAGNTAIFNNLCTQCDATVNNTLNIGGIRMDVGYVGAITQASGAPVYVGTSGFTQHDGTFIGGNSNIEIEGNFSISGGAYTAPSAEVWMTGSSRTLYIDSNATFVHNNGTIGYGANGIHTLNAPGVNFYRLRFESWNVTVGLSAPVVVLDQLVFNNSNGVINNSYIDVRGNISLGDTGAYGSTVLKFTGNGPQNIVNFGAMRDIPGVEIAKTGGALTLPEQVRIAGQFIHTSGSVDASNSHVWISSGNPTISAGPVVFNDLTLGDWQNTTTLLSNITVTGDLVLDGGTGGGFVNGYQIDLSGNLTAVDLGLEGTTVIRLVGLGDQTVSAGTEDDGIPSLEINKTSGLTSILGEIEMLGHFIWVSGSVDASNSSIQFWENFNTTITPGPIEFDDVLFGSWGNATAFNITSAMTITGDLTLHGGGGGNGGINGGPIKLYGSLYTDDNGMDNGGVTIQFVGSADTLIDQRPGDSIPNGPFIVNKTGGAKVSLANALELDGSSQDLTIQSGTLDMNGYDLTVSDGFDTNNVLTLESGTTLNTGCGSLTYESLVNNGGTIIDGVASPNMTITDASGNEGTTLQFTVSLDAPRCSGNVTVNYASASGTAISGTDFTATSGTLTFAPGETIKTINVVTTQETTSEGNETFTVSLSSITNGTLVDNIGVGTIINDDLAAFTWTGLGANSNWTTAANWSTTVVPGTANTAIFNNLCTQCGVTLNGNVDVGGIAMYAGYSGAITQGANWLRVRTSNFYQEAGDFVGGSGAITMNGHISIVGGTFKSSSDVLHMNTSNKNFAVSGGSFLHNNGYVYTTGSGTHAWTLGDGVFFNWVIGTGSTHNLTGSISVSNMLHLGATGASCLSINGGEIVALGSITTVADNLCGDVDLRLASPSGQLVFTDVSSGADLPNTIIDSGSGVVTFSGGFILGNTDFTYVSGNADTTNSWFWFYTPAAEATTIDPGPITFSWAGIVMCSAELTIVGGMTVTGPLAINGCGVYNDAYGAPVTALGDVSVTAGGIGGLAIKMKGGSGARIDSDDPGNFLDSLEIAKTGGVVTIATDITLRGDVSLTSGAVTVTANEVIFDTLDDRIYLPGVYFKNAGISTWIGTTYLDSDLTFLEDLWLYGECCTPSIQGKSMTVYGNLWIGGDTGFSGSSGITLAGNTDVTFEREKTTTNIPDGKVVINKPGATVTLMGQNFDLNGTGQDLWIQAGTLDMNGYNLTIADRLTINSGAAIYTECGTLTATGGITNNGTIVYGSNVNLTVGDVSVNEAAGSANVVVSLTGASCANAVFNYTTLNDTALSGNDYTAKSGMQTILASALAITIPISITNDTEYEGSTDEIFRISLSSVSGVGVLDPVGVISIEDNDTVPTLIAANATVAEDVGSAVIAISLTNATYQEVTFSVGTRSDQGAMTATINTDFTATSVASVTIPAGSLTTSFSFPITNDNLYELTETAGVTVGSIVNAANTSAVNTVYINDNEPMPTVSFNLASQSVSEDVGTVVVTITQSAVSGVDTTIPFTVGGNATGGGTDYTLNTSSPVSMLAGVTIASITLSINNDANVDPGETISLAFGTITNASGGVNTSHVLTINDNDVSVAAVYPTNGLKWNDYVKNDNGGTDAYDQPDTACAGSESGYYEACIHGGEKRKVVVTGYSSCSGLDISDALEAWKWRCLVKGGTATFFTSRLADGKGLADLIDTSSNTWRENSVAVTSGGITIAMSPSTTWGWTNTITGLPDNSGSGVQTLSTASTIYTLNASRATGGYNINADRIAILIKPGATLSHRNDSTNTCAYATGETASPDRVCTVAAGSHNFLWIEGHISGYEPNTTWSDIALVLYNVKFSRFHNLTLSGVNRGWFVSSRIYSNLFSNIVAHKWRGANHGFYFYTDWVGGVGGGSHNRIYDLSIYANTNLNNALKIYEMSKSVFFNTKVIGGDYTFTCGGGCEDSTYVNSLIMASKTRSFEMYAVDKYTVSHMTALNSAMHGVYVQDATGGASSDYATLNQLAVGNIAGGGLLYYQARYHKASQVAIDGAGDYGVRSNTVTDGLFTNNVLMGTHDTANCEISGGSNPGHTAGCANQGTSNATWRTGISMTGSFVGKVTINDGANGSDSSGTQTFGSISDWNNFDNWFRAWGNDGGAYPDSGNQDTCTTGTCRIWDASLSSSDSVLRNKSGDGLSNNDAFVASSTCPSAVHGNKALTDQQTTPNTFLVNATEIMQDEIGDDDGLCESNEACIYSPNFGVYQGHGDYLVGGTCTFQNGTVTGVQMYAYPNNGR